MWRGVKKKMWKDAIRSVFRTGIAFVTPSFSYETIDLGIMTSTTGTEIKQTRHPCGPNAAPRWINVTSVAVVKSGGIKKVSQTHGHMM